MEVINIQYNGTGKQSQTYSVVDTTLITDNFINSIFGDTNDYIEFFITDESGQILDYLYDSKNYTLTSEIGSGANQYSSILIDPEKDVKSRGFDRGRTIVQYNFFKRLFNSSLSNKYWIKEISTSRLELKLSSQTISGDSMNSGFNQFQSYIAQKNYYGDFYLNFGNNNLVIAVNAAYVNDNGESYILIKLYEQLPLDFDLKSELWIVDKLAESTSFLVDIQVESEAVIEEFKLRGPNYSVQTSDKAGQTTPYYSYQSLFSSPISSSTQQLLSYYDDKAISINVNYASFDNFIHFSSAAERINNFAYKVGLIETYNTQIAAQSSIIGNQSITSASIQTIKSNINNIIEKFDGYEYYLYYTSGAFAWPKSTKTTPYSLYSVTSSQALSWLGSENTLPTATSLSILYSASLYDNTNKDILRTSVPQYLLDDPSNQPYVTFMDMIGQHFDNIWIYYKDVTNRFNATNNPDTGISLDLVADAIRSLGIQLYTNTNLSDNVFYSLFGYNQDGSLLPPTGSEGSAAYPIRYVTSSISGSGVAYTLPYDQIQKEIYKRIYHNLPYLLKTRGTERGVKALIACYGIPDSILTINEFGGYDRYSQIGIEEIYNNKITVISGSNELSESLLSRYSTLQRYDRDNRKNSLNIEVGFSPANTINQNISASLGYFAIDNLIGNPRDQYSSSYQSLVSASNSYFSTYTKPHSIWEYIRLIKFYNNSLFKMIKDFAPARSSVSSGIIIKPHVLERSKYKRNEPQPIFQNNYSESIDMVSISGSHATSYTIDTTTYESAPSLIGYIPITSSFGFEKYTGEFQGTDLIVTDLNSLGDQSEYSNNATTQSLVNRGALFQNISKAVRSQKYLDLDYGYDANVPVNFGIITQSIDNSQIDNYSTYTNTNNLYAELQDYNYFAQRSTIPRYYGSKLTGLKYNVYTTSSAEWQGDNSYGNQPVINHNTVKIAWVKNIPDQSLNFLEKTTINLKYLVDINRNLTELSYANNNLFEVQNTFKSGDSVIVSLSDVRKPSNQINLDGIKTIFRGGFTYNPILYRENGESLTFRLIDNIPFITLGLGKKTYDTNWFTYTGPAIINQNITDSGKTTPDVLPSLTSTNNNEYFWSKNNTDYPSTAMSIDSYFINNVWVTNASTNPKYNEWKYGVDSNNNNPYKALSDALPNATPFKKQSNITGTGDARVFSQPLANSNWDDLNYNGWGDKGQNYHRVYSFDLLKFQNSTYPGSYNTEDTDVTANGTVLYKVPRTSTYNISGSIIFSWESLTSLTLANNNYGINSINNSHFYFGANFKIFGIVEKSTNPNAADNAWTYVADTRITRQFYNGGIQYDRDYNCFHIPDVPYSGIVPNQVVVPKKGAAGFICEIVDPANPNNIGATVSLQTGEYIRFKFYIIDLSGFMRWGNGGYIKFQIGYPQANSIVPTSFLQSIPQYLNAPFFDISDVATTKNIYEDIVNYTSSSLFVANNDTITFSSDFQKLLETSSIFEPTSTETSNYYSPVVDNLSILPGDLIRIDSIRKTNPQYYNVITSSIQSGTSNIYNSYTNTDGYVSFYPSVTFALNSSTGTSLIINPTPQQGYGIYSVIYMNSNNANLSFFRNIVNSSNPQFTVSGLVNVNDGVQTNASLDNRTYTLYEVLQYNPSTTQNPNAPGLLRLIVSQVTTFVPTIPAFAGKGFNNNRLIQNNQRPIFSLPTTTITYANTTVVVDRNIIGSINNEDSSFAILRPKPNETSVIINYKKQPGEVSQTILLPQDLSTEVKSQVGDIFKDINNSITNNTITQ